MARILPVMQRIKILFLPPLSHLELGWFLDIVPHVRTKIQGKWWQRWEVSSSGSIQQHWTSGRSLGPLFAWRSGCRPQDCDTPWWKRVFFFSFLSELLRRQLTSSGKVLFPNSALPAVQILVNLKFLNNCFLHEFFPSPPITSSTSLPTSQADWSGRFQKGRETQPAQHWPTSSTPMSVQSSCPLKNKIVK